MSVILFVDDSPHAQRMGERILKEEGYEVVSLADGKTASQRMAGIDADVLVADAFLPDMNGFDLCRFAKSRHPHIRVILTAGLLESLNEEQAQAAGCDAILKKPFEASVVAATLRPLVEQARKARGPLAGSPVSAQPAPVSDGPVPVIPKPPDPVRVREAVQQAVEAALPQLIREITEKVLVALGH